ncbi:MAG: serine hydrolase domain-containing protein, partial [Bacteroidales bacterium]
MKKKKIEGLSIAVTVGDKVDYIKGFGYANKEERIDVTEKTVFKVGSISKVFTGMAIMQLQEQGKLNIDDPVTKYLPEFKPKKQEPDWEPITIRMILTHHSGIPSEWYMDMMTRREDIITTDEMIKSMNQHYLAAPPNTILSYSNAAITLLGKLIERVSGEKFEDYVDNHILKPSGMNLSSFQQSEEIKKHLSKGYVKGKDYGWINTTLTPAGMLLSNAEDMAQFMIMINNGGNIDGQKILKQATIESMWT